MINMKRIGLALLLVSVVCVIALSSRSSARNHRIEDLEYALEHESADVRVGAITELTTYGEPAIPVIKRALKDIDPKVRETARRALGKIGGEAAAEALAGMLSHPDHTVRVRGVVSMIALGKPALPHLLKVLESDPSPRARMFAAYGVAQSAGPGDAPAIMKLFPNQPKATKMYLVAALINIRDDDAYRALGRIVNEPDRVVRYYVANTMAEHPDKRDMPILIDALNDDAPEVRMWAMYAIEKLNIPESYPIVLSALDDESYYVRKEAAYTLGILDNSAAVPHLIPYLNDPNYIVRCDVAESLGKLGDPQAIPALKPLLAEESEAVRIRAAEALARLDDYSGMETLIASIKSPDYRYKVEAHEALKGISDEDYGEDFGAWSEWWKRAKEEKEKDKPNTRDS